MSTDWFSHLADNLIQIQFHSIKFYLKQLCITTTTRMTYKLHRQKRPVKTNKGWECISGSTSAKYSWKWWERGKLKKLKSLKAFLIDHFVDLDCNYEIYINYSDSFWDLRTAKHDVR